jgi:uncharacterized protein
MYDDPTTQPFWEGARGGHFMLQHCRACGHFQFYPRPMCLSCDSQALEWVEASGEGTIWSQTTVHVKIASELDPPYVVAVVQLDEGPHFTSRIAGPSRIGDRVAVLWEERDNLPPLPVFRVPDGR